MSRIQLLKRNLEGYAKSGGGSFKTVSDRLKIAGRFARTLAKLNIQIKSAGQIKVKHIELYVKNRLYENISKRTLQNEMSAIRKILSLAGQTKMADPKHERISNKSLKIDSASRLGTKFALSDERYHTALALIKSKDENVAAVMQLARSLGLRNEEAVQSVKSIYTWKKAILQGDNTVRVIFGTKGGRSRNTTIIDHKKTLDAINNAIKIAEKNNGKLINKSSLSQAMDNYINTLRRTGNLKYEESCHSLRYAYAQDAIQFYINQGYSEKEAYALTSIDLGHGDGRGDYIKRVYSRTVDV